MKYANKPQSTDDGRQTTVSCLRSTVDRQRSEFYKFIVFNLYQAALQQEIYLRILKEGR